MKLIGKLSIIIALLLAAYLRVHDIDGKGRVDIENWWLVCGLAFCGFLLAVKFRKR